MLEKHAASETKTMNSDAEDVLKGAKVLVLEDETLVSMMVEDMLMDLGCEIIGPFSRLDQALNAVKEGVEFDMALLDVNLGGERSFPLAEVLAEKQIPFVFTTGYDESGMPDAWRGRPSLRKPFMMHEMAAILRIARP